MEDLLDAIKEIVNEEILKIVISNKSNKDLEYNKINEGICNKAKNRNIICKQSYNVYNISNTCNNTI